MATRTARIKFQSELKDNEPNFFTAEINIDYHVDPNYGADADGNRGVEVLFINEIKVYSCFDQSSNMVELPLSDKMMDAIWEYCWENFQE